MSTIEETLRSYYSQEMTDRAVRPLGEQRQLRLAKFISLCEREQLSSVAEIGCGAGRDSTLLESAGMDYMGLDFSDTSVAMCRALGLKAVHGSALDLPFDDDQFDSGWSMSTLMHLPGDGVATALSELKRVVRTGGLVEIGVWGGDEDREWTDEHGRYFLSRTDEHIRAMLATVGELVEFATWSRLEGGGHYQWGRVLVAA